MIRDETYAQTAIPRVVHEGARSGFECLRVCAREVDRLNGLIFKGEIVEFLMREHFEHHVGVRVRGIALPDNIGRKDFFVLLRPRDLALFERAFAVERRVRYEVTA